MRNPSGASHRHHPQAAGDKVDLTIDANPDDIDQKLRPARPTQRRHGVQPRSRPRSCHDPTLKTNADDPVTAATRYMAVIPSVIPNIDCRKAIFYAINKADGSSVPTVARPRGAIASR